MAIYFSEKFRQNRKAKDLTQEQLAEIFHVSPQAVSRWEIGATCPDIELLPSIASFFNITVDELLGVDKIKDKERITEIEKEIFEKWADGHLDDVLEIARNAVREFPQEYILQLWLSTALEQKNNLPEAITILERILENSTDDNARYFALFNLSRFYKRTGDKEKAVNTAKKLSSAGSSSDVVLTQIYEGGELHEQLKRNIALFSRFLADAINQLASSMFGLGSQEKNNLINKAIGIFDLIYENGDYGFNNFCLSGYYNELAKNYYHAREMENALDCLEKMAQCAIDFETPKDFKNHTSLAVQGLGNTMMLLKSTPYNHCNLILHDYLTQGNFELIKDNERYKAVIAKLEKHAHLNI